MRQTKGRRMRFLTAGEPELAGSSSSERARIIQIDPQPGGPAACSRSAKGNSSCLGTKAGAGHATASAKPVAPAAFDSLMFSERFMVWSIRFWTTLNGHEQKSLNPLADAFRIAKIPGALGPFDAVMTVATLKASQPLTVRSQRSGELSSDEMRLLFLTAAKPGRLRDAVSSHLLRCQGTALLRPLLAQLGEELDKAGLRPPRRIWEFPEVTACAELFPSMAP